MGEQLVVGGDIIAVPPVGEFAMTVSRPGQVVELKGRHP